jgi:hypothetical protein
MTYCASCNTALGNLARSQELIDSAVRTAARAGPAGGPLIAQAQRRELVWAYDEGWEQLSEMDDRAVAARTNPVTRWAAAGVVGSAARTKARLGMRDKALALVALAMPAIERAPGGSGRYTGVVCNSAQALWELEDTTFVSTIERNLLEKTIALDFRQPVVDARLAMAYLCSVQGRIEEACEWFAKARVVLEEQGARPLRAICDHDEALALVRHSRKTGAPLDRARVRELLEKASAQFVEIGMTGWITRAKTLSAQNL